MQAPEYRENKIHTGWLDSRIAMRVRVERPAWHISVVGGALYVSHSLFSADIIGVLKGLLLLKVLNMLCDLLDCALLLGITGIEFEDGLSLL